jgi:diaminopimelate epimerase
MSAGALRMTKHHGLGNDFLVLLEPPPAVDAAGLARRVCDRHRGIGADGLLIAHPGRDGADVTMELRNADGGRAEMSGNGIRCFAQAVWDAGLGSATLTVSTDAGVRTVRRVSSSGPLEVRAAVDMGPVKVLADAPRWIPDVAGETVEACALVDAGNPHLVLLDRGIETVEVESTGRRIEAMFPDGMNVEWIWPVAADELVLKVWERGAGRTEACGTGSCAAVAAAVTWGKVGRRVTVRNPGGPVTVELGETAVLTGPSVRIAVVEVPWP